MNKFKHGYSTFLPIGSIGIDTSTDVFSLEGEGWDEGDINSCFNSPLPSPLPQRRGGQDLSGLRIFQFAE